MYQSVSTSGPRALVKPMDRKMAQSSSMTWVTGCRPPFQSAGPGRERSRSESGTVRARFEGCLSGPPGPPGPCSFTRLASAPTAGRSSGERLPEPPEDPGDLAIFSTQVLDPESLQGLGFRRRRKPRSSAAASRARRASIKDCVPTHDFRTSLRYWSWPEVPRCVASRRGRRANLRQRAPRRNRREALWPNQAAGGVSWLSPGPPWPGRPGW